MTGRSSQSSSSASRRRARLWCRRIVTGAGLLALLALMIWGIVSLIALVAGGTSAEDAPQSQAIHSAQTIQSGDSVIELRPDQTATRDGIVSDSDGVTIPACAPKALRYTLSDVQTRVGEGATLSVSIENVGAVACMIHAGALGVRIVSGEQTMYDSHSCDSYDPESTPLLLAPGVSWSGSVKWDGHIYSEGCVAPAEPLNADAGTYRAALTLAGTPVGEEAVCEILP